LTVGLLVTLVATGGDMNDVSEAESPTDPVITTTPAKSTSPSPTPSVTMRPDAAQETQPPTPEKPAAPPAPAPPAPAPPAPKPAAPQPDIYDPAIITMNPGPSTGCGEYPSGQTTYLTFTWGARDGNTVDVFYALTDTDVQASGGFILLGSDLPAAGSVKIPRTCPNGPGHRPYLTVKLVAKNSLGSATAFYWGL
jgi:hypothetical protein